MPCFNCCSPPTVEEEDALVVDLHTILTNQAWDIYKASLGPVQRLFLKKKNYKLEVPDNYFLFEQVEQTITPRDGRLHVIQPGDDSGNNAGNNSVGNNNAESSFMAGKISPKRDLTNPEVVSLDTEFSNDTASTQKYNFRFEKQRTSEISVSFQSGYTMGGSANFKVGLPLVGEAETEATMEYTVENTEEQRFEETMTMEATSEIQVGPNSCYVAQVQLEEKKVMADFKVVMRMSMPQGRAPVYIRRRSDDALMSVYNVNNLKDMFCYGTVKCAKEVQKGDGKTATDKVDFVVQGVIRGTVACNHRIQLRSDESAQSKSDAQANFVKSLGAGD